PHVRGEGIGRWRLARAIEFPAAPTALRHAMAKHPRGQILLGCGHYDVAPPHRAVEHALAGLGFDLTLRKNISIEIYEAGHMMYLHAPSLHKLKRDGAALIDRARGK